MQEENRKAIIEVEEKLVRLLSDDGWIMCKQTNDGSKVMKQCRTNEPTVYLFNGLINGVTVEHLTTLINPLGPFRIQWDTQLKEIELLERVDKVFFAVGDDLYVKNEEDVPNTLKVRHLTHSRLKGMIAERETFDLCRFYKDKGRRAVVMTDTSHPSDVPKAGVVRGRTHLSALVMEQNENGGVDITAIVQVSAFLCGLPTFLLESYFPKAVAKFFDDLKKACQEIRITNHSYEMPPGW